MTLETFESFVTGQLFHLPLMDPKKLLSVMDCETGFAITHPEYKPCPRNAELLLATIFHLGLSFLDIESFVTAYDHLKRQEALELWPTVC